MENMGIMKLAEELEQLNPNICICAAKESYPGIIIADCDDVTQLNFPEGYYFSEKNGLTNKHNTSSGQYESFELISMSDYLSRLA